MGGEKFVILVVVVVVLFRTGNHFDGNKVVEEIPDCTGL